jgi:hypothetical protein
VTLQLCIFFLVYHDQLKAASVSGIVRIGAPFLALPPAKK